MEMEEGLCVVVKDARPLLLQPLDPAQLNQKIFQLTERLVTSVLH